REQRRQPGCRRHHPRRPPRGVAGGRTQATPRRLKGRPSSHRLLRVMASAVYNSSDPYEQLIAQMIRLERQPQTTLKAQKSEHEVQRAVLNDFDSALSALHTALKGFTDVVANPFAARKATVSSGATFAAS